MRRIRHVIRPATKPAPPDRGLDGVNLLLAASGSVYGAFIPVFLTQHGWTQANIGFLLALNMVASMVCQVPAGLMIDLLGPRRRVVLMAAVIGMGLTPLLITAAPTFLPVLVAMVLQAATGSLLTPAVSAISLAVAGQQGFSERLGRNARYGSIGAAAGALVMGLGVNAGLTSALFLLGAAMTGPTLWTIARIRPDRVQHPDHGPAHPIHATAKGEAGWQDLLRDRRMLVFFLCITLFSLASAGVLQLASVAANAALGARSGLVIALFVILPQIVVAICSPAIARAADIYGRRQVLLAGFATLPLRAALFALLRNSYGQVPVQVLEGFGGAIFGVMLLLVASDLTHKTGYYTLCLSLFGLAAGLGTAISNTLAGILADLWGWPGAFWALAGCGAAALVLLALAMPETAPPAALPRPSDPPPHPAPRRQRPRH